MKKIGDVTNTADKNGEFTNGNISSGTPPTILEGEWLTSVQREIINVLKEAGVNQNPDKDNQLSEAVKKIAKSFAIGISQSTGNSETEVMSQKAVTDAISDSQVNVPDASTQVKGKVQLTSEDGESEKLAATQLFASKLRKDLAKESGANLIGFSEEFKFNEKTVGEYLQRAIVKTAHIFPLDDEGAKGNGVDSDDDAFEKVIAKIKKYGGGIMHMTPGKTYRTTYTHLFPANFVMSGLGAEHFFDPIKDGSAWLPETFQSAGKFVENIIFEHFKVNTPVGKGNYIGTPGARYVLLDNLKSDYIHWHLIDGCNGKHVEVRSCKAKARSAIVQIESITHKKAVWGIDKQGNELYPSFLENNSAYWSYTDTWHVHDNDFDSIDGSSGVGVNLHGGVTMSRVLVHNNFFNSLSIGVQSDGGEKRYLTVKDNTYVNCNRSVSSNGNMVGYTIESNTIYNTTSNGNYSHIIHDPDISSYSKLKDKPIESICIKNNKFINGGRTPITMMYINGTLDIDNNRVSAFSTSYYTSENTPIPNGMDGGISFAQIRVIDCNKVFINNNKTNNVITNAFISLYNSVFSGTDLGDVFHEVNDNTSAYGGILLVANSQAGTLELNNNYTHGADSGSFHHIVVSGYTDVNIGKNNIRVRKTNSTPIVIRDIKNVVSLNSNTINSTSAYGKLATFDNCPNVVTSSNVLSGLNGSGAVHIEAINGTNVRSFEPFMDNLKMVKDETSSIKNALITYQ